MCGQAQAELLEDLRPFLNASQQSCPPVPARLCATTFSVVVLTHTRAKKETIHTLNWRVKQLGLWKRVHEVIIAWNGELSELIKRPGVRAPCTEPRAEFFKQSRGSSQCVVLAGPVAGGPAQGPRGTFC